MQHFTNAYKNYAKFDGRATRTEYWMFYLFFILCYVGLIIIGSAMEGNLTSMLFILFILGSIVPTIAITVRRLHDIGKGGAAIFYTLIPLAGPIIHLVQMCTESKQGDNKYGPDPHVVQVPPTKEWQQL